MIVNLNVPFTDEFRSGRIHARWDQSPMALAERSPALAAQEIVWHPWLRPRSELRSGASSGDPNWLMIALVMAIPVTGS